MSSHSSNNSNADMEVINVEDLEDSPPPGDAEDVTAMEEMKDAQESLEEEVVEATASGDTEQIGDIVDFDEVIVNKSVVEEVAEGKEEDNDDDNHNDEDDDEEDEEDDDDDNEDDDDDDPPIKILEAPTLPLAEESVPESAVEVVPVVEVALVVEVAPVVGAAVAADPTLAAALVETQAPTSAAAPAAVNEDDDDPPIEILEAPTPPLAQESVPEPEVGVAPAVEVVEEVAEGKKDDNDDDNDDPPIEILEAPTPPLAEESVPEPAVEVAQVVEVAPTPAAALVETQAPTSAAAPAAVNEDDDDPPFEILEAPTPPLSQESVTEPEVAPAVEVAPVETAAPKAVEAVPTPAAAIVETTAPTPAAAPAPAAYTPAPQPQVVSVRPTVTAERPAATLEEVDDEEEDDDDIDETLVERLVGLTEMFPDFVRNGSVSLVKGSWSFTQSCYGLGKAASWVVFSSATILFMPIMIESERLQMQDQMKAQKNQILLGPGAAMSGGPSLGPPPI